MTDISNPGRLAASDVPTRRTAIAVAAAGLGLALLTGSVALAQKRPPAGDVDMAELMKPGEIADLAIGPADAKVVIVEYASLTCPHCASFHKKVYPALKTKYVDTGKVRFVFRDFPLQDLAAAGAMLARCAGPDKAYDVINVLFDKQEQWAFVATNPAVKLFELAKQMGFTQESFDKCLTDQKLLDQIDAVRKRASEKFQVNSTPTFFINGKRLAGPSDQISTFDKALEPLLKN